MYEILPRRRFRIILKYIDINSFLAQTLDGQTEYLSLPKVVLNKTIELWIVLAKIV